MTKELFFMLFVYRSPFRWSKRCEKDLAKRQACAFKYPRPALSSVLFTFFLSFFFSCSWPVTHNLRRTRLIKCLLTPIYHLHRLAINSSTYRPYTLPAYYPNVPARLRHCRLHLPTLTLTTSPRPLIRHCQYGTVPRL